MNNSISTKTTLTGLTGAGISVLIYVVSLLGADMPPEVAAGIVTIAMALIAYFVPAKQGKYVITEPLGDGLDPEDAIEEDSYEDPIPAEVSDPQDDSYVEVEAVR